MSTAVFFTTDARWQQDRLKEYLPQLTGPEGLGKEVKAARIYPGVVDPSTEQYALPVGYCEEILSAKVCPIA